MALEGGLPGEGPEGYGGVPGQPDACARPRLFRRYLAVLSALVVGTLAVAGVADLIASYQSSRSDHAELQRLRVEALRIRIASYVEAVVRPIGDHAARQWVVESHADEERAAELRGVLDRFPEVVRIRVVGSDNRQRLSVSRVGPVGDDPRVAVSDRFIEAARLSGIAKWGEPFTREDGSPWATLAIADADGGAVTLAEVGLHPIREMLVSHDKGERGSAYLVDALGRIVVHPRLRDGTAIRDMGSLLPPESAESPAGTIETVDQDGIRVLRTWARLPSLGWAALVEQPLDEAFAPVHSALRRAAILLLAGLLVAIAVGAWLARRMARPVVALQAGAARIGAGRLNERIDIRTGDELEELAHRFNQMAERLRDSHADLETRVAAKTRELAVANERLRMADRHKSEFLASISHELRTPLNAVIGFSEVLGQRVFGDLTPKQDEYVRDIHASGLHLLSLINDILDLSRIEAGRMDLELSRFDLAEALAGALTLVRDRGEQKGVSIALDVGPEVGAVVADERRLKQIVLNLLSNAIKFSPDGGRIDVVAAREAGHVAVTVRDAGIGIAAEDQEVIFEAFRQVGPTRARHEGSGLGLALVRRMVELHGGTVSVNSAPGKGAVFAFTIPDATMASSPSRGEGHHGASRLARS